MLLKPCLEAGDLVGESESIKKLSSESVLTATRKREIFQGFRPLVESLEGVAGQPDSAAFVVVRADRDLQKNW